MTTMLSDVEPHLAQARGAATPIVIVGHVDHGKSTLIGRLLYDTNSLPEGRHAQIVESSRKRGRPIEWSFLLDSLQIERDQGVTVDSTRIPFQHEGRDFVIVDAPGHRQFLRNMLTGAADAEAAVLVVDAGEGVQEQTRRHAMLLHLIGIRHVVALINKADLLSFDEAQLLRLQNEVRTLLTRLGLVANAVIPASARDGDNIATPSTRCTWYHGPTLTQALALIPPPAPRSALDFRMTVQDVYRFDDTRYVAGRVERGVIGVGDKISVGVYGHVAHVAEVAQWHPVRATSVVGPGASIALRLTPDIVPDRGDLLYKTDETSRPAKTARIRARVFWLRQTALQEGERLTLRLGPAEHAVTIASIDAVVNLDDMTYNKAKIVPAEAFAEVTLTTAQSILFDAFTPGLTDGRGVLVDAHQQIVGAAPLIGVAEITSQAHTIHPTISQVSDHKRALKQAHGGRVFWLYGRPASGKTTVARDVEQKLFDMDYRCVVLDGDTLRAGLNSDLAFTAQDRRENIRRTAHVARLFAETGHIVLVAMVSPTEQDRACAATIIGDGFAQIHIDSSMEVCEARDPKGLYAAARAGEIKQFTGIDAPFEASPENALTLHHSLSREDAADKLCAFITAVI